MEAYLGKQLASILTGFQNATGPFIWAIITTLPPLFRFTIQRAFLLPFGLLCHCPVLCQPGGAACWLQQFGAGACGFFTPEADRKGCSSFLDFIRRNEEERSSTREERGCPGIRSQCSAAFTVSRRGWSSPERTCGCIDRYT